ncbi:hypothetical protein F5Y04DRAFT_142704 [Hypomontagnella monticulosa]|nr:hypothetical protein F5Y04DRAFT_142704 [Hypomontagnella monticulosa]
MEILLESIGNIAFTEPERAIANVLKATLQYPVNTEAKASKLADDIEFFCKCLQSDIHFDEMLWEVWRVVLELVSYVPPDHQWQESLVQSLVDLRQRNYSNSKHDELRFLKDLSNLSFCVREYWNDPTDVNPALWTGETDKELLEEFFKWKNLNSFVARVTSTGFAPWLNLPIWQLRVALEEPPLKGPLLECQLWVASEWIIYCADLIFEDVNSKEELNEAMARVLRRGSLCADKPPLGIERWEFWKKRFSDLSADADSLGLNSTLSERMTEALKKMESVEK